MAYDRSRDGGDQPPGDDGILHFMTMTEDEFRDLLRSVADEVRRERAELQRR